MMQDLNDFENVIGPPFLKMEDSIKYFLNVTKTLYFTWNKHFTWINYRVINNVIQSVQTCTVLVATIAHSLVYNCPLPTYTCGANTLLGTVNLF